MPSPESSHNSDVIVTAKSAKLVLEREPAKWLGKRIPYKVWTAPNTWEIWWLTDEEAKEFRSARRLI